MIYNEGKYNQGWQTKKLSDLGEFSRGVSKHRPRNDKKLFEGGGYPLVQTGEIKDAQLYVTKHNQEYGEFGLKQSKLWDKGTLCITIAANIAETAILAYPMCFPDSVVGFTAYKSLSSEEFMYYVFGYIRQSIQNAAGGSIQDNINIEYLTSLDFKIPDIKVQNDITKTLASIDRKILNNDEINENLAAMAKTIYDYWFTQFDFPDENGKPYRSSGGQMVWNEQLKREIPNGWTVKSLSQIMQKKAKAFDYASTQPTVDLSIMPSNSIAISQLNSSDNFSTNLFGMNCGDILFGSIRPYLHKAGIAPCDGVVAGTVHSYEVFNDYDYNFALITIARDIFFDYAVNVSSGTKMPVVSNDAILSYKVPYNEQVVRQFAKLNIKDIITENAQENQQLMQLRDWLLPMLMNGQATVSD